MMLYITKSSPNLGDWLGGNSPYICNVYPLGGYSKYMYARLTLIFMLDTMCWLSLASLTCIVIINAIAAVTRYTYFFLPSVL